MALLYAESFIDSMSPDAPARKAMVQVDHLVFTFTQYVLVVSQLELLITSGATSFSARMKWLWRRTGFFD